MSMVYSFVWLVQRRESSSKPIPSLNSYLFYFIWLGLVFVGVGETKRINRIKRQIKIVVWGCLNLLLLILFIHSFHRALTRVSLIRAAPRVKLEPLPITECVPVLFFWLGLVLLGVGETECVNRIKRQIKLFCGVG